MNEKIENMMKNAQDKKSIAREPQKKVVVSLHFTVKKTRQEIEGYYGYEMVEELVPVPKDELNEWGYPANHVFNGCTTTRTIVTPKDGEAYTLVEHTNVYSKESNPTGDSRSKADLKDECKILGLKIGGNKADLIARLDTFYATVGEEE